ncbi:putative Aryl-alcohol dehydrogenase [Mycena sanguinolenta]|uniref:Putative Aryl-alcohol dehydrogenase n=1 Tax=Mycena sanguinolenta TaxID=230812 RepID=A0A8H6ZFU4_9AGAR|nr:putative Aryl-alcohol dehydrogenase [Mycena sanguinolenta]
MSFLAPPPAPLSKLGVYRKLSSLAGVHVSPLQLGAMSIGDKWSSMGMGEMDKESSFKLLDTYYDLGGNFIDTANSYQDESSESFIGEWAEKRGIRDQLVIATKYSTNFKARNDGVVQKVHYVGNNIKSMHISVEASLKKLRTTYIDILYVHWWDWDTSIEEVMNGLHNLVVQGKVLYLGVSDTPAWVVAQANQYARDHGKTPFVIYQGRWNVLDRSFEREIIPMARAHGLALAPWLVVGAGKFRTDAEEERMRAAGEKGRIIFNPQWERTEDEKKVSKALEKVAAEVGTKSLAAVAIAYVMAKVPYCFPIIGGRKVEHLTENLEALDISLSSEQIAYLEGAVPFNPGFPTDIIGDGTKANPLLGRSAHFAKQPILAPIPHTKD